MPYQVHLLWPFLLYLAGMVGIGLLFYFRTRNLSDYILGGRRLGSWVTALSAQASDMSGWLLLGLPGYAYLAGIEAFWIAIGLTLGTFANWQWIAPRLRAFTDKHPETLTLPGYFENRFGGMTRILRLVSAFFILIFFMIYTSSGFVAGAKLFSSVFGLSYSSALFISVFVIIVYVFLGGFLAVCWTDLIQGLIMFLAILVVPFLAINHLGGFTPTIQKLQSINGQLLTLGRNIQGEPLSAIVVISLLAWGLGYFGQPHILIRFMAIRKTELLKKSRWIAMVWVILCLTGAVLIGLTAQVFIQPPLAQTESETVFMVMVGSLVPSILAGFLMAAVLAAIMSTADSQLLVASSAFTEDLYRILVQRELSSRTLLWISRIAVVVIALLACLIATNPNSSVLDLVSYAWAGFGASFGPLILLSLFWKKMTGKGAIAGIISGGVVVLIWKPLSGGLFDLYEIVPGFLISILMIWFISRIDKS